MPKSCNIQKLYYIIEKNPLLNSKLRYFMANLDIKNLGQVFTPPIIVKKILDLRKNYNRVLEPSVGNGAFLKWLDDDAVAIEIDPSLSPDARISRQDFFDYPSSEMFDTIIGNPPYVRYQDIPEGTKQKLSMNLFDGRSNLYLFFIEKSVRHLRNRGELIFITPRDFLKLTSARKLNEILYQQGSFTDFIDLGDQKIFSGATPNCAIWRWQKGRVSKTLQDGRKFCFHRGQIWFGEEKQGRLDDYFSVKVGAVSGADAIFTDDVHGCTDFVCSHSARTGKTRRMIYNRYDDILESYKETLINRKIKAFHDDNWWQWGRAYPERLGARIYVNCKTRNPQPFFIHSAKAFDGSVLALFPKFDFDLEEKREMLNRIDWQRLGFVCDGRYIFNQRALANAMIAS